MPLAFFLLPLFAKDLMKVLNTKMTSASCNFKISKRESPTKTNSSCQTLTFSNLPLINPNGNKVDNTNDLEHLEQLSDSFISQISINLGTQIIIKNSRKHSINSKTLDLFNKYLPKIYQSMKQQMSWKMLVQLTATKYVFLVKM